MILSYILLIGTIVFIFGGIAEYLIKKIYTYEIKKKSNNPTKLSDTIMDNARARTYKKGLSKNKIQKLENFLVILNKINNYNLNILLLICAYVVLKHYGE